MTANEIYNHEYKFLSKDFYRMEKSIDLKFALKQVCLCLESENVPISINSFLKCVDIYTRITGLCRSTNQDEFPPVLILCGAVEFKDVYEIIKDDAEKISMYCELFDKINDVVDEDHKFPATELEIIKNNLPIVLKEVVIFLNDIVCRLVDEYMHDGVIQVTMYYNTNIVAQDLKMKDANFAVNIERNVFNVFSILIQSSMLVPVTDETSMGIAMNTFDKDTQKIIESAYGVPKEYNKKEETSDVK